MKALFERLGRPNLGKYTLRGGIILTLMFLLTINIVFADVNIKFYGEKQDYIYKYLEKYDLKGLKWVLVFPEGYSSVYGGYYYPGQIRLFYSDESIFVHELAHHYDFLETRNFQRHTDNFYKKEAEIWANVK